MKKLKLLAFCLLTILTLSLLFACQVKPRPATKDDYTVTSIESPYADVDFAVFNQYKSNLHSHTKRSDAKDTVADMLDTYEKLGFDIYTISDHNKLSIRGTGLSTVNNRRVFLISATEVSYFHHFNAIFTDYLTTFNFFTYPLIDKHLKNSDALIFINHPGKRNRPDSYYHSLFSKYGDERVLGMEVFNHGNRYSTDRARYDRLLTYFAPDRRILGFSNDDAHEVARAGYNFDMLLLNAASIDDVTEAATKSAIQKGEFFFGYFRKSADCPEGYVLKKDASEMPRINSITVNPETLEISVNAENFDTAEWISCSEVVGGNLSINVADKGLKRYVRLVLKNKTAELHTQPFLLK